jgi:hypothetical protein
MTLGTPSTPFMQPVNIGTSSAAANSVQDSTRSASPREIAAGSVMGRLQKDVDDVAG